MGKAALWTLLFFGIIVAAVEYPSPPPPDHYILDLANVVSSEDETRINELCREVERTTGAEMAVLTILSFEGEDPWQYATTLGNRWGVGQASEDNGLVMAVAITDRQVYTATGSGMEAALPDATVYEIYKQVLVPYFRNQRYGEGIFKALQVYAREIGRHYDVKFEGARGVPRVRKGILAQISILGWIIIAITVIINLAAIIGRIGKKAGARGWFWTTFGSSGSSGGGGGFSGGSFGGGGFSGGGGGGGW